MNRKYIPPPAHTEDPPKETVEEVISEEESIKEEVQEKIEKPEYELLEIKGLHVGRRAKYCEESSSGDKIILIPEEGNKYDNNAVKILRYDGKLLGYIDAENAPIIQKDLLNQVSIDAYFDHYEEVIPEDEEIFITSDYTDGTTRTRKMRSRAWKEAFIKVYNN